MFQCFLHMHFSQNCTNYWFPISDTNDHTHAMCLNKSLQINTTHNKIKQQIVITIQWTVTILHTFLSMRAVLQQILQQVGVHCQRTSCRNLTHCIYPAKIQLSQNWLQPCTHYKQCIQLKKNTLWPIPGLRHYSGGRTSNWRSELVRLATDCAACFIYRPVFTHHTSKKVLLIKLTVG